MISPLALLAALTVGACYSPQDVRRATIVYSTESGRSVREAAECIRNRHLLDKDYPIEVAYDDRDGSARVTAVMRDTYAMHGGVWLWELAMIPRAGGGSQAVLRSNSSIWGPFAEPNTVNLVSGCLSARG